jgi:hypothetical protein
LGVNLTDWKPRRGSSAGDPVDPLQVPNQDGAGVVEAVGLVEDVAAPVLNGAVRVGREAGLPLHHYSLEQTARPMPPLRVARSARSSSTALSRRLAND